MLDFTTTCEKVKVFVVCVKLGYNWNALLQTISLKASKKMHGICFLEATKSSVGKTTWLQVQVQLLQSSVATDRNYDPDQITSIKS